MTTPPSIKAVYEYKDPSTNTTSPSITQTFSVPITATTTGATESPNPYLNALYTKLGEIKTSVNDYLTSEIKRTGGAVNDEEEKAVGMEGVVEDDEEEDQ